MPTNQKGSIRESKSTFAGLKEYASELFSKELGCEKSDLAKRPHTSDNYRPRDFSLRYLAYNLWRKLDESELVDVLELECIDRFKSVEKQCSATNRSLCEGPLPSGVENHLSVMRRKISSILKRFEPDELASSIDWGPGATASLKGRKSTRDEKILEPRISVSLPCRALAQSMLRFNRTWAASRLGSYPEGDYSILNTDFEVLPGGRFTTVAKDTSKRRGIDIQPTANMLLQKGLGKMLRSRLKENGVDLDKDQSRNRHLAELAYSRDYATIDLENASDSVSRELVRAVLPEDWYDVLNATRTRAITMPDGSVLPLEKFSAMGNGFTFELESLIFYAACHSVVRVLGGDYTSPIAVYGDDLIVSQTHAPELIRLLNALGFTVNIEKSFIEGAFYESCGKHFYLGCDVTPAFQKEVCVQPWEWIAFHNRLHRWLQRFRSLHSDCSSVPSLLAAIEGLAQDAYSKWVRHPKRRNSLAAIPRQPVGLEGDGGLIDENYEYSHVSTNGFAKITLFSTRAIRRPGRADALYAWGLTLGARRADFDQWFDRSRAVVEVLQGLPSYGFVTPRGLNSNSTRNVWLYVREPRFVS